ncbi:MAG: hypothetical protein M1818_005283 [Claussenomyces sp. TS43310]|nr:MAG: hypothetical protein M1818_005283 [Claussenomyces sp. TS43310]
MSSAFHVKEHIISASHIREYARATSQSQEQVLQLAVKQYIPKDNPDPGYGDVTIIGGHANGFPKELYEPLWIELHARSKLKGFKIRGIWIADVAHQGASGVLNEHMLGNDPSYLDHARDLLHMINHFRVEMPMPLVGVGHSMGANQLVNVALIHPRLFSTLVLLDPVIQGFESFRRPSSPLTATGAAEFEAVGRDPAQASTYRRDLWPSREEATKLFRESRFYRTWDSRVLDKWIAYGLRETPTAIYPQEKGSVTLTTTKHQEVYSFLRPTVAENEKTMDLPLEFKELSRIPNNYRPEISATMARMPNLRPSTLFVFGSTSPTSTPKLQQEKMEKTGIGMGGNGGAKEGRVKSVSLDGIGHLVAMEAVEQCADAAAPWLGQEMKRWKEEADGYEAWTRKNAVSKITLSEEHKKLIGGKMANRTPKSSL